MKINDRFKIAEEKANEVVKKLNYDAHDMVDTDKVKDIVEEITGIKIAVGEISFNSLNKNVANCGAMMRVDNTDQGKKAYIVLNSDKNAIFKRFSFVHELGHIITDKYNFSENEKKYTISAHINYNLTSLSEEQCTDDYLINEQIANVFALLVLMPNKFFTKKLVALDSIKNTADFFGITPEAVMSRMRLGE